MFEFHRNERLLFAVSSGVFVLLTLIIALLPAIRSQSRLEPLPKDDKMTKREQRGLQVYIDEGCAYCHTQQVRPLPSDSDLGRPSVAADYARLERLGIWRQTPAVLGSERTGPDLTTIGERQPSENWHLLHLYQPRAVVEDSVMPAFKWLFRVEKHPSAAETTISVPEPWGPEAGTVVATERAQALVAYLKSLQQAPLPGASTRNKGGSSASAKSGDGSASGAGPNGESIYESKCASCHQSDGGGVPGTFPPLAGDPVVTADDPTRHVEIVLDGLQGKTIEGTEYGAAMPAFGSQLKDSEIAAVINHERTSWGNDAPTITAEDVAAVRSGKSLEGDSASDGEPDAGATADTSDDSDAGSTPREAGP